MTVDEYMAEVSEPHKAKLNQISKLIKSTVPESELTISYAIPTYKYKGKPLIHFASFKHHMSIFPTVKPMDDLADKVKAFRQSKGTLQFTLDHPIPDEVIVELILVRKAIIDSKS